MFQPINIYDVCIELGIDVQFVEINMEGLYINNIGTSKILLSSLRPVARRVFTCAHELGHHVFNHGLKVDTISEENEDPDYKSDDEKLVDAFAAALLMPVGGIQTEFAQRDLDFVSATPTNYYTIASAFGVGYQTLITHCRVNNLIDEQKSVSLNKMTPAKIFKTEFGEVDEKTFFKIIDGESKINTIDLEVSNYIVLPSYFNVSEEFLEKHKDSELGTLYRAKKTGVSSIHYREASHFIRIQPQNYIGYAEYRHLGN